MFYLSMTTLSYMYDTGMVLVRIVTRDKYTLESFTNFPIFSLSLREFWGQRYNQLTNTVLKESVFQPMRLEFSSSAIAGFITFIISGLLHVHGALVAFDDTLSPSFQAFLFFVLHGIACYLETDMKIQLPEYVRWLITHIFLLITAPLMFGPFMKSSTSLINTPPPFLNVEWIPKLPIPNFCPQ